MTSFLRPEQFEPKDQMLNVRLTRTEIKTLQSLAAQLNCSKGAVLRALINGPGLIDLADEHAPAELRRKKKLLLKIIETEMGFKD